MNQSNESKRGDRVPSPASQPPLLGLWHLALWIEEAKYEATRRFYREGMNMRIVWEPDPDNVYLSSGADNLALHRRRNRAGGQHSGSEKEGENSPLDHLGFLVPHFEDVKSWHDRLERESESLACTIVTPVRLHRDGATSFYVLDPAGNRVQIVHIPEISAPTGDTLKR